MEEKCQNCKFMELETIGEVVETIDERIQIYSCRRFPPAFRKKVINKVDFSNFPEVLPSWACGEFKAKPLPHNPQGSPVGEHWFPDIK